MIDEALFDYATPAQANALRAIQEHGSARKAAKALGVGRTSIDGMLNRVRANAARQGYAPEHDMSKTVPDGYMVKGVSSYYNRDGNLTGQWVKTTADQERMQELIAGFLDGLKEEFVSNHKPKKAKAAKYDTDHMACHIIGDHHFGMLAWSPETGDDDYDIDISTKLLVDAFEHLIERTGRCEVGMLLNVGDFFHANDTTAQTPNGKNLLDTDGRFGRTIRKAAQLFKQLISMMLDSYETVVVINARGNHDPDAELWLNEMLRMYYEADPRVVITDNYAKLNHYQYGTNLIVTHHGDKINSSRLYEQVTRQLSKEWGECSHRYCWTGHIHHKQAEERGGMTFESWNVLPSPDAWHAGAGYGSSRSMSCVLLHKEYGEAGRFKATIDLLKAKP